MISALPYILISSLSVLIFSLAAYWGLRPHEAEHQAPLGDVSSAAIRPEWIEMLAEEERFFSSKGF